jgi:5-aminopentanamidase
VRLAAIQFAPTFREVESNLRRLVSLIVEAANKGASLIVCPELIYGYSYMSKAEAEPFAEVLSPENGGKSFVLFRRLAAQLRVAIVWGVPEKDPGTDKLYNSQALVFPDGRYASYRKINRFGQDWIWAEEGTSSPPIIDFMGKQVGLLICRDVRDKSEKMDAFYEKGDADVVCFSSAWGRGGFPSISWVDFAKNNGTILVVSNRYGKEANNDFGEGGSCIISPKGEVHCEGLVWGQDCIIFADIP